MGGKQASSTHNTSRKNDPFVTWMLERKGREERSPPEAQKHSKEGV
jgi:hypothetical protein